MAEISELGESLLQRTKDRNEKQYQRSRREAYKIALGTAGVGLLNSTLQKKADQFMQSEQVLAQKAKYRAAAQQAQTILGMNDEIVNSGKTPEQYFADTRYLPAMQEQFKAEYGTNIVPTSYMPQLLEQARSLASEEAERFRDALEAAQSIPDYETAMSSIDSLVMPPRNVGAALVEKVSGVFRGKSEQDFRDQAVDSVRERGLIKNETWERLFNNVSEDAGIDAATAFVSRMDSRGFTEAVEFETQTEIVATDDGGYDVISTTVATNIPPGQQGPRTRVETSRVEAPTRTRQRVEMAGTTPFVITEEFSEGGVEVVEIKDRSISTDTPEGRQDMAKALMDANNPSDWAKEILNPAGLSQLAANLNEQGVSLLDIRTPDQFATVVAELQGLQANKNLLLDPQGDAIKRDAISSVLSESSSIIQELTVADIDEDRRATLNDRLNRLLKDIGSILGGGPLTEPRAVTTPARTGQALLDEQLRQIDEAGTTYSWTDS